MTYLNRIVKESLSEDLRFIPKSDTYFYSNLQKETENTKMNTKVNQCVN